MMGCCWKLLVRRAATFHNMHYRSDASGKPKAVRQVWNSAGISVIDTRSGIVVQPFPSRRATDFARFHRRALSVANRVKNALTTFLSAWRSDWMRSQNPCA